MGLLKCVYFGGTRSARFSQTGRIADLDRAVLLDRKLSSTPSWSNSFTEQPRPGSRQADVNGTFTIAAFELYQVN